MDAGLKNVFRDVTKDIKWGDDEEGARKAKKAKDIESQIDTIGSRLNDSVRSAFQGLDSLVRGAGLTAIDESKLRDIRKRALENLKNSSSY